MGYATANGGVWNGQIAIDGFGRETERKESLGGAEGEREERKRKRKWTDGQLALRVAGH